MRALSGLAFLGLALAPLAGAARRSATSAATQTNLVSDQPGVAAHTDPNLANSWGLAFDKDQGTVWIADNHSGKLTQYRLDGTPVPPVVDVPTPSGSPGGAVTGLVFNDDRDDFHGDRLIGVTEDGLIVGSSASAAMVGSASEVGAIVEVDNSASGAVYKGVAIAKAERGEQLYATNFSQGRVDVFDTDFRPNSATGAFVDPDTPAGFAPFNIVQINRALFVSYAKQTPDKHDDQKGPGNGFIDVFDTAGKLRRRFVSGTAAGGQETVLNSPWGMTFSRARPFVGDFLVGNFGSGVIAAFDRRGDFDGTVDSASGALVIDGLWSIAFGPVRGTRHFRHQAKTLFFTAGPDDENHGLFGTIDLNGAGIGRGGMSMSR